MCFFTRLKIGHPGPLVAPKDTPNSWKVYHICETSNCGSSTTFSDVAQLDSMDTKQARETFIHLSNSAQTGLALNKLYDEKKCHEAHSFIPNGASHEEKIWRIWGSGAIRIYFIYLQDKKIVILKTSPKRTSVLTKGEKKHLEDMAQMVLNCLAVHPFDEREI